MKGTRDKRGKNNGREKTRDRETEREREREKNKKRDLSGVSDSSDGSGPNSAAAHPPLPFLLACTHPPNHPSSLFPFPAVGGALTRRLRRRRQTRKILLDPRNLERPESSVSWLAFSLIHAQARAQSPPNVPSNKIKIKNVHENK